MRPPKRTRVEEKGGSGNKLLVGFFAGVACVLAVVVVVLLNRGEPESGPPAAASSAANPAPAAAPAAAPTPAPRTAATVRAELDLAPSAKKALSLGEEARRLGDEALAEAAIRRAFDLDPDDPAVVSAAEVRPLVPDKDFRGLSDVRGWPQSWLVRRWIERKDPATTRWQREALAKEWATERARVEARHKAAESDPYLRRIDTVAAQVATLPVFEKMKFGVIESTRPFALFVETKERDDAASAAVLRDLEANVVPYLTALREKLDETLLKWLGLTREPDDVHVIWVVRSFDRYREI